MKLNWKILPATDLPVHQGTLDTLNRAGAGTALLGADFVLPLLREFGNGSEVLALCESPDGPQALALLLPRGRGIWETFQPSQDPVGAWLQRPGLPIRELLRTLLEALPGFALAVGVTQQDPDLLERPADGGCIATLDYIRTARITFAGTFERYWEARGRNLKTNMRRQRARLEKDGVRTALEILREPADIAGAIADYGRLESAGWKAAGGTAIAPDNAQGRFYRTMLEEFCRQGRGCVYRYRFDERVVALDLCVEDGTSLIILKTTYDESIKTISPAFLMRQESFGLLFGEGRIRRIEFYGKLMEWHTRWSDEARTMYHVNCYRWSWLPKMQRLMQGKRAAEELAAPAQALVGYLGKAPGSSANTSTRPGTAGKAPERRTT